MWVFELLSRLGINGEHVTVALVFAMIGWYVLRGKSAAGSVVAMFGTITTVVLGVLGVLAVAVGLGWMDPEPGVFLSDAATAVSAGGDLVGDVLWDWLTGVLP